MTITTKFDIGQPVWALGKKIVTEYEPCLACGGSGRFEAVAMGSERRMNFQCPQCLGSGKRNAAVKSRTVVWEVLPETTVMGIDINLPQRAGFFTGLYYRLDLYVENQNIWRESDVFGSAAEARAAAAQRNKDQIGLDLGRL